MRKLVVPVLLLALVYSLVVAAPADAEAPVAWTDAPGPQAVASLRLRAADRQSAASPAVGQPAAAEAAVWAACGWRSKPDKLVRLFQRDRRRDFALVCGDSSYGYRHILDRHRRDFEGMAVGTYQNWRDVADLSMAAISSDPDVVKPAGGNQTCRSRVIFLVNIRNGRTVRQQVVKMYTDNSNINIRTAFPSSQCR